MAGKKITIRRVPKRKTALQVARTALSEVKNIKKNIEIKHYGKLFARGNVPVTGAYAMKIIDCAQTTTAGNSYTRIGDEINLTSMYLRVGLLYNYNALNIENNVCRLIIFIDKDPTMSGNVCQPPNISDLLEVDAVGANPGVTSHLNYTKLGRFKILYDRTHVLTAQKGNKYISYYKKWKKGLNLRFQATGGDANYNQNVYAFVVTEKHQGAVNYEPNVEATLRVSYIDA